LCSSDQQLTQSFSVLYFGVGYGMIFENRGLRKRQYFDIREQIMKRKELIAAAEKLQIDPGFCNLTRKDAGHSTDYYGITRNKGKWEIYYCDWHGPDVRAVYDTEDEACEAFYQILKDEENRIRNSRNERPNRRITKTICRHKERMEVYFEDCAVLIPGEIGCGSYWGLPRQMEWLAPPEKAGQPLSEADRKEILALEPILRAARDNPIVFLYDGELYRAAAVLAKAVHEKRLRFWFAKRRLRKAFPELPKRISDGVFDRAYYFDTR